MRARQHLSVAQSRKKRERSVSSTPFAVDKAAAAPSYCKRLLHMRSGIDRTCLNCREVVCFSFDAGFKQETALSVFRTFYSQGRLVTPALKALASHHMQARSRTGATITCQQTEDSPRRVAYVRLLAHSCYYTQRVLQGLQASTIEAPAWFQRGSHTRRHFLFAENNDTYRSC